MITLEPEQMQSMANELNYYFFICDGSLTRWAFLSTPLLRLLRLSEDEIEKTPDLWMSLVDLPREVLSEKIDEASNNLEHIQITLPFLKSRNEKIELTLHLSSAVKFSGRGIVRIGSAEIENEDYPYKQEALQARDNEIEISARIQRILLTGAVTENLNGLEIAAETIPSKAVDGDFYEFLQLSPNIYDFIIGDVMGKGVPAALLAAAIKASYYKSHITSGTACGAGSDIRAVIRVMDSLINQDLMELNKFLTLYYCRLNMKKSMLSFIDAGHTCFIYYDSSEDSCWSVKGANMPMGFASDQDYHAFLLPFEQDDLLFFYSDGISEVKNSEGEMFGLERIRQLIKAHCFLPAEELLKKVLNVTFFFAAQTFDDDVTGFVIRITQKRTEPIVRKTYSFCKAHAVNLEIIREEFSEDLIEIYSSVSEENRSRLVIALMEACSNCISYSTAEITLEWKLFGSRVEAGIRFHGPDYDWYRYKEPATEEYQQAGFGHFLIEQGTDSSLLMYGREDQKKLILIKEFV